MGAADGPVFAPPKPGSNPIIQPPCPCPECVAGPGLDHAAMRWNGRVNRVIGELTQLIANRFCPGCKRTDVVCSFRNEDGTWTHVCESEHVWQTTE